MTKLRSQSEKLDSKRRKRLEAAGWKFGSAEEFLGLSHAESVLVELRLRLSDTLKQRRQSMGLSQEMFAKSLNSSQSRVAKMEAADSSVSIDLLVRGLIGSGLTLKDLSDVLKEKKTTVS